ncbi:MAG: rhomboid family intramembrane serine protease [Pyrinomonadaceae bacterium]
MSENQLIANARAGRPNVCRSCGAIVGAGETACGQCGATLATAAASAPQTNAPASPRYDREAMRFARAVFTRPAIFSIVFIAANVFVFLLMTQGNPQSVWEPSVFVLRAFGAKFNSLINAGQWWRFITPVFIHIGVIHLLVNMYGLFMLGPYVEKLYGSAKFVVFWILTGAAGVAASYFAAGHQMHGGFLGRFLFRGGDGPSAGASGALFGLIGVLFVFGIKFRHELPEDLKRAFGAGMLPTILLNLFIGYSIPFIDNAAHLGGLVAGALLALVVGYKRPHEKPRVAFTWHLLQIALLALAVLSFVMVARHFRDRLPNIATNDESSGLFQMSDSTKFIAYFNALNEGQQAFVSALKDRNANATTHAIEALDKASPPDEKTDALRNELRSLLVRALDIAAAPPAKQRARKQELQLIKDFQGWQKNFKQWLDTDSAKYGLQVQETATEEKESDDKK